MQKLKCKQCGSKDLIQKSSKTTHYCGNCDTNIDIVFCFVYNSECCEGSPITISIHKTQKNAEIAMEFHRNEVKLKYESEVQYGKDNGLDITWYNQYPFNHDQYWGIEQMELLE